MIYAKKDGTNQHVIVLLHGTGGNEHDLMEIGGMIDTEATLIGLRGRVVEHGMHRYFKRHPDGSFDLDSLMEETNHLVATLQTIIEQHGLASHVIGVLGYSNGANIALNIIKEHPMFFQHVIALHPTVVRPEVPYPLLDHAAIFLSGGIQDSYTTPLQLQSLVEEIKRSGATVEKYFGTHGHQINREEIQAAQQFYRNTMNLNQL